MQITKECQCCGTVLAFDADRPVVECPACGTMNQRPNVSGLMLDNFRHAIRLQAGQAFCRAESSYDFVLNADPDNAEALWGRLLCHYGAAFIDDNGKRRYEIHFPDPTPMREQVDFIHACELADPAVRAQWEEDAAYIDRANQEILRLAKTKPAFDIFLCHKTTLPNGGYTEDYNRAYALYNLLTRKGYRVFFAPVEMAGVSAGENYEAGIHHALETSRVMLVVSSDPHSLQAKWVHSEWRRFMAQMDAGADKCLIPLLYGGMKAGQLPSEFQHRNLQAITMELGGEQPLLKAIQRRVRKTGGVMGKLLLAAGCLVLAGALGLGAYFALSQRSGDGGSAGQVTGQTNGTTNAAKNGTTGGAANGQTSGWLQGGTSRNAAPDVQDSASSRSQITAPPVPTECPHTWTSWQSVEPTYNRSSAKQHSVIRVEKLVCTACGKTVDTESRTDWEAHSYSGQTCVKCGEIIAAEITNINVKNVSDTVREVTFTSTRDWQASESEGWMTLYKTSGSSGTNTLQVKLEKNTTTGSRTGRVWLTSGDVSWPVDITQNKVDSLAIQLSGSGDNRTLTVTANGSWSATSDSWIALGQREGYSGTSSVSVSLSKNPSSTSSRSGKIWVTCGSVKESVSLTQDPNLAIYDRDRFRVSATVEFGHYEQDGWSGNGKEPIEWKVLDKKGNYAMLFAVYALDAKAYQNNGGNSQVTWSSCTLRTWLNGTFYNNAFSASEKAAIRTTTVSTPYTQGYDTYPGPSTQDKVYLLSYEEVQKYNVTLKRYPTQYALDQKVFRSPENGYTTYWWLRSPHAPGKVAVINSAGQLFGSKTYDTDGGVCPVIWVDLSNSIFD